MASRLAPRAAMQCWVCGRSPDDVRGAAGKPVAEQTEIDRSIAKVNDQKTSFARSAGLWEGVPEQFRMMDFGFVLKNPSQFRVVSFIGELDEAKRSFVDGLGEAALRAAHGEEAALGEVHFGPRDKKLIEMLVDKVEGFERRSGRSLLAAENGGNVKSSDPSKPIGISGLSLGDGIRFLKDAGMLYYSIEQSMLEAKREEESKKQPPFGVAPIMVNGFSKGIPLCTICENLIREL